MGFPWRRATGAVGLSIEEDTVKYAELLPVAGGRYRVGIWGTRRFDGAPQPLPEDTAPPETESELREAVVTGGPLMQPWTIGVLHKLKNYPVFASFADREVLLKFISLPALTEQEVARMIELRYREYLPMQRAEIVYDFSLTRFVHVKGGGEEETEDSPGSAAEPGEEELRVMVIGIERGAYLGCHEVFAGQGIILRSLETNQAALTRGCNFILAPDHSGTYAVLYLNDTYSMVNFIVDHGLYYSRLLEHGVQSLAPDEAGKRRSERLLRELYRSVDFFSVESRGVPIETLYLANGSITPDPAITRRIQRFLGDSLSVEVRTLQEVVEKDDRITLPSGTTAGTLVLPLGLALRLNSEVGV